MIIKGIPAYWKKPTIKREENKSQSEVHYA
jgi:hypothetical protein